MNPYLESFLWLLAILFALWLLLIIAGVSYVMHIHRKADRELEEEEKAQERGAPFDEELPKSN